MIQFAVLASERQPVFMFTKGFDAVLDGFGPPGQAAGSVLSLQPQSLEHRLARKCPASMCWLLHEGLMSPHRDGSFVLFAGQGVFGSHCTPLHSLVCCFLCLSLCVQPIPRPDGNFPKAGVALHSLMQELSSSGMLEPTSTLQKDCFEHPRMGFPDLFFFLLKIQISNASGSFLSKIKCMKVFSRGQLSQKQAIWPA